MNEMNECQMLNEFNLFARDVNIFFVFVFFEQKANYLKNTATQSKHNSNKNFIKINKIIYFEILSDMFACFVC